MCRRGSTPSLVVEAGDQQQQEEGEEGEESSLQQQSGDPSSIPEEDSITTSHGHSRKHRSLGQTIREKSWFGKKCVKIFRVFSNTFAMTFLAEWGDRSQVGPHSFRSVYTSISAVLQLATIVMAGINDVAGVCVGGVLGHTICTGLAGQ